MTRRVAAPPRVRCESGAFDVGVAGGAGGGLPGGGASLETSARQVADWAGMDVPALLRVGRGQLKRPGQGGVSEKKSRKACPGKFASERGLSRKIYLRKESQEDSTPT